jgi:uncharacterized protein YbjT (DUF2867 family)
MRHDTAHAPKRILVLGASGLIGQALAVDMTRRGHAVTAVARRFTPAQKAAFAGRAYELPVAALPIAALAALIERHRADLVVNCVGILQDGPGGSTAVVHQGFVQSLLAAIAGLGRPVLLVHISIPGDSAGDRTAFSRTKRQAERAILASGLPHVILRPGLVVAPAAFGGSAMLRALAALPVRLPAAERETPFQCVAIEDIAETLAWLAAAWSAASPPSAVWDLMHPEPLTLGDVIDAFRAWLGASAHPALPLPSLLLDIGARAGDAAGRLGWAPPIRSTALAELRRGVSGDPGPWLAATGIVPRPLGAILQSRPSTIQERWFARLYLLKGAIVATLAMFWILSGLIALAAYGAAVEVLTVRGIPAALAHPVTLASSLADIAIGVGIAVRRSCRAALVAGIAVALLYMAAATLLTPDLWLEPLGALVKTGPAIVLMLVALALTDDR